MLKVSAGQVAGRQVETVIRAQTKVEGVEHKPEPTLAPQLRGKSNAYRAAYPYRSRLYGFSLLELLISAILGVLVVGAITTVLLGSIGLNDKQAKQRLLQQSVSDAIRYIVDDIRRAGYNETGNQVARLQGSSEVVYISEQGKQLSYLYRLNNEWVHVSILGDLAGKKLKICREKTSISTESSTQLIPHINSCSSFYSLFDERLIKLRDLSITLLLSAEPRAASPLSAEPRLLTLFISAQVKGDSEPKQFSYSVYLRY